LLQEHARLIELETQAGALIESDRQRVQQHTNALAIALATMA
jgi:hypothetical protein